MQFVSGGPDIPDSLLQAHEDGRVVFFCGAGISYPAGLPGFRGLVDEIYKIVGTVPNQVELEAYSKYQYDAMLDLLERRLPGQRLKVRNALAQVLKPNLRRKGAKDTHLALLQLARSRDGATRLVTTNFDQIFARLTARSNPRVPAYPAPLLPIPKNSRWNGLVYLHGLLSESPDESELNRLVVTSGDFGLAYLTERWASRFVSELFRNYVVCFVGYSINDPVLRYMMDALAADRMLGELTPQAYALGDCEDGDEAAKTTEWTAKGVVPILYGVAAGKNRHSALHRTLKVWGETYRDGILGKERIVVDYAMARPSASTRQDDFVGRMLWALSDVSGLPARRLAEFEPAPSLEWLKAFFEDRYQHADLMRFGVPPRPHVDKKLAFNLVLRPAPYGLAPWMALVSDGAAGSDWDDVMYQLARWLVRHLDDPDLILWLAARGGHLHPRLEWLIDESLGTIARLEIEDRVDELARLLSQAPRAIPRKFLRPLWRLLLAGRVRKSRNKPDVFRWKDRLKQHGLTATLRFELRELLAPKIEIRRLTRWRDEGEEPAVPERLNQVLDWDLVLAAGNVHSSLIGSGGSSTLRQVFPDLFDDFQQLLRDALDLLHELGAAEDHHDRSHWDLPSVSPHAQNKSFREWVVLIELVRDAWLGIRASNPPRATGLARAWVEVPYPTFKRLALFAASQEDCVDADEWVDWLLADNAWWLWSIETRRETLRLLVLQGRNLTPITRSRLETAILAGPPRSMYRDAIDEATWQDLVDRSIWLLLAKLASGSPIDAVARLAELSAAHPAWALAANESDEFSHWMSGTGDPDFESSREVELTPRRRSELVEWLEQPHESDHPFHEDKWGETCRTRFYHCALALSDLAQAEKWPIDRWREALQIWREDGQARRSWRFAAPLVSRMPEEVLQKLGHAVAWWLDAVSKSLDRHADLFLQMCQRVLGLQYENGIDKDNYVTQAINHPVGNVAQALLNLWFERKPNDNDRLPVELEPFFTKLCDREVVQFRHGRVLLASRLISLFRVDRVWTETHLLPLFDWHASSEEARAAWEGFLWSPRLYRPLLIAFRSQFLETSNHYEALGEHAQQFAAFLTYAALDPAETYTVEDYQAAIGALPPVGLQEAARTLAQAVEGAGEQREDYWTNRAKPFWHDVWPKSLQLASPALAENLARLSIEARGRFPEALAAVFDWLQPIEQPDYVIHLLHEAGLAARFPEDSLRFLNAIIDDQPWVPRELRICLNSIVQAAPDLARDSRHQRLDAFSRQRAI